MAIKLEHILIVEDDISLANGLCRALVTSEVRAESCGTLKEAARRLVAWEQTELPLLLLDINLPDGNGFDFLKTVKETYDIPVIMLTANDMETDIVTGLEQGAEDYITKPFSLAVLRARVAAVLRRRQRENAAKEFDNHIIFDDYDFDFDKMLFYVNEQAVELSKTEQKLLRYFMKNRGITLNRDMLIDRIWTDGSEYVDENALSVAVKRLRDKLSAHSYIRTVYGVGYVWKEERREPDEQGNGDHDMGNMSFDSSRSDSSLSV